ncbi:MAG: acyl-CoA thioesterase [Cyanobacteria bacterium J083]|nr:MAG: acyl-CoA thioesterase [Cyanobacteria bacterium J083]
MPVKNYYRTIRLSDTDAAGVIYFANLLSICHEAYEESLRAANIDLNLFLKDSTIAIPIVQSSINFFRPISYGDSIYLKLNSQRLNKSKFAVNYQIFDQKMTSKLALATTIHTCIALPSRQKIEIPHVFLTWLENINK